MSKRKVNVDSAQGRSHITNRWQKKPQKRGIQLQSSSMNEVSSGISRKLMQFIGNNMVGYSGPFLPL